MQWWEAEVWQQKGQEAEAGQQKGAGVREAEAQQQEAKEGSSGGGRHRWRCDGRGMAVVVEGGRGIVTVEGGRSRMLLLYLHYSFVCFLHNKNRYTTAGATHHHSEEEGQ
jgi:hypothetical protein